MLAGVCVAFATMRGAEGTDRPNVVFILADDLGWGELGCYGQQRLRTPNIDRLATEGMRFTRHYSGAPVCAPSRCVLMTGKHLGKAEIRGNIQAKVRFPEFTEGQHPLSESAFTIAQAFRKAGYATAAMGKWGLGPVGSTGDPGRKGFDLFFGYNCQAVAHKGSVYEGGLRVPMIVRWPGRVAAGTVSDVPGYFADWFPTLCDVAGLERPEGLDGTSLWPVMKGGKALPRKPMGWVFPEYGGQVAVRIGGMKAVRQRLATKSPGPWEVYDVDADPGETRDLASVRPEIITQAEQVLREEAKPNAVFPVTIPGM